MIWGYCESFAFICSVNEVPNGRMTPRGVRGNKPIFADSDPREEKKELDGLKPRTEARMEHTEDHWDHHNPWQVVASKALEKDIRHTKNTYIVYIHIGVQMKFSGTSNSLRENMVMFWYVMYCYVVLLAKTLNLWFDTCLNKLFGNQSWYEISGWSQESRRLMCLG